MADDAYPLPIAPCPHGDPVCTCGGTGRSPGTPVVCRIDACAVGHDCPNEPALAAEDDALAHCHVEGCNWRAETPNDCTGVCGLMLLGAIPVLDGGCHSMTQARPGSPLWSCGWLRTPLNIGWKAGYLDV